MQKRLVVEAFSKARRRGATEMGAGVCYPRVTEVERPIDGASGFLKRLLLAAVCVSCLWSSVVHAAIDTEQLGEFRFSDFLVEPSFRHFESNRRTGVSETGFSLGNTYFSAEWELDRTVAGRLQLSSLDLIKRPSWARSASSDPGFGFSEAYAEFIHSFARLRAGLLPVRFGLEGSTAETQLWFPRGFLYEDGVLPLRDQGAQLLVRHRDFFLDTTVHNGEGSADRDQRVFHTVRLGWGTENSGLTAGLSGTAGFYKIASEASHTRLRAGNLFVRGEFVTVGFAIEATSGERKNLTSQSQFLNVNAQLRHQLGANWGGLLKYEHWDPNSRVTNDLIRQGTAGLYLNNDTLTSRLSLIFIKNWDEGDQLANDEYWITWRITSLYSP